MKKIKLLVCYHKPDYLIKDEVFTPIHLGRAIAKESMDKNDPKLKWFLDNMIGDDTGDNISLKNKSYNELTSLYWAWKNFDKLGNPDFIGLVHYRRHFVFTDKDEINVYTSHTIGEHYFEEINYTPERLEKLLSGYDFACHLGKVDGIYKHYLENHRLSDMETALNILKKRYPEMRETADEYMAQNVGNFCNMFIFPKNIFFDYCKYIFGILQEFEDTVDTSEKRFFISERLTGIFIYNLIKQGKKYRVFPINFVAEPIKIPVSMPLNNQNAFSIAVTVTSMLKVADKMTTFRFYMISNIDLSKNVIDGFEMISRKYKNCEFIYVNADVEQQYFPLVISEKIPEIKKCLYINENFIVMHDLAEFFRTCSVDDYYVVGLPLYSYDLYNYDKAIRSDIFMLNCDRLRKYGIFEKSLDDVNKGVKSTKIINFLCKNQIGYFPSWFTTISGNLPNEKLFPSNTKTRSDYQLEATWRPIMYYSDIEPWINIQGVYSIFWWNLINSIPINFKFPCIDSNVITNLMQLQQKEINHTGMAIQYGWKDDVYNYEIPVAAELRLPAKIKTANTENSIIANRNELIKLRQENEKLQRAINNNGDSAVDNINENLINERDFYAKELDATRNSFTFKLAHAMTYIPRKVRGNKNKNTVKQ